jgi:hypothetical protein
MTVAVQALFNQPQHEIASLLRDRFTRCAKAYLVESFITMEGIEAIAAPLRAAPHQLARLVAGGASWPAFDALDRLLATGLANQDEIRQHTRYRTARLVLSAGDQLTPAGTLTTWSSCA